MSNSQGSHRAGRAGRGTQAVTARPPQRYEAAQEPYRPHEAREPDGPYAPPIAPPQGAYASPRAPYVPLYEPYAPRYASRAPCEPYAPAEPYGPRAPYEPGEPRGRLPRQSPTFADHQTQAAGLRIAESYAYAPPGYGTPAQSGTSPGYEATQPWGVFRGADPDEPGGAGASSGPYGPYGPYRPSEPDELYELRGAGGPYGDGDRLDPLDPPKDPGGQAPGRRGARRKRASGRPDPLRKLLPQALVVAFLAGGTSAFIANDKAVELSVDGSPRTLHTFAGDVEELLTDEHVTVGPHDLVTPAAGEELASGDEVVVRYGRPVTLTLDGVRSRVWTTARTVDGALRQFGVRAEGAYLSASRSATIGRHGLNLNVRTERTITFMVDGRERTVRTNAATVQQALDEAGITLRGQDAASVAKDSFPREGQTISVLRITDSQEVREEPIGFDVVRRPDPELSKGTESVVRQGEQGLRRVTYRLRTVNGVKQKPKRVKTELVKKPVTQVVHVGTKAMPASVQGADGLNWSGLAHCEAGGRPDAVDASGTYGGLYQFDVQTWQAIGGSGRPQDAPAGEQTFRAKQLYVTRGASPWPHCGRKLQQ
ncbi:ubiquitin-like domain-containing protein [Streptomyces sp. H27-D2]|uniref:ubiquitin-like domain-containing protein n=1 Tax=Streptomyces sp. H27-D2 TaxID=3046304 RepID=UPI002DBDA556|nr:ubiquitin-like domain-containing protein [Streptomyces sp. H27-D2]MEC4015222.1 ubiquitin-like domain-containing protein [Streptomyces sp. H27-D2]